MPKGIVYIDVEDEITTVIDKVESAAEKVLALVLPKHATTFLSTVNMKLLKKAGDTAKKSLVLITSDEGILPLAGTARLHVAKSLQSKPTIPAAPKTAAEAPLSLDAYVGAVESAKNAETSSATTANSEASVDTSTDEVIQLDNTTEKSSKLVTIGPKNKKLKVPNFNSFRLRLFLLIFTVLVVVVGVVFGLFVLPKAKIVLRTDVTPVDVNLQFVASTTVKA